MLKWLLFISSYLPLYILITILNIPQLISLRFKFSIQIFSFLVVIVILTLISIIVLLFIIFKQPNRKTPIGKYEKLDDSLISYIMTYLVPLLSIDVNSFWNMSANLILFLMIGLIYTKNDLVYLNPLLSIVGFYVYKTNSNIFIITKIRLTSLEVLKAKNIELGAFRLANDVFIYKRIKNRTR